MTSIFIPAIDEQFVSDAWNTIDPKPSAKDIAELWVDQQATQELTEDEFASCVEQFIPAVEWYMTGDDFQNGEES
jgi:hypothetical protein